MQPNNPCYNMDQQTDDEQTDKCASYLQSQLWNNGIPEITGFQQQNIINPSNRVIAPKLQRNKRFYASLQNYYDSLKPFSDYNEDFIIAY